METVLTSREFFHGQLFMLPFPAQIIKTEKEELANVKQELQRYIVSYFVKFFYLALSMMTAFPRIQEFGKISFMPLSYLILIQAH